MRSQNMPGCVKLARLYSEFSGSFAYAPVGGLAVDLSESTGRCAVRLGGMGMTPLLLGGDPNIQVKGE